MKTALLLAVSHRSTDQQSCCNAQGDAAYMLIVPDMNKDGIRRELNK